MFSVKTESQIKTEKAFIDKQLDNYKREQLIIIEEDLLKAKSKFNGELYELKEGRLKDQYEVNSDLIEKKKELAIIEEKITLTHNALETIKKQIGSSEREQSKEISLLNAQIESNKSFYEKQIKELNDIIKVLSMSSGEKVKIVK